MLKLIFLISLATVQTALGFSLFDYNAEEVKPYTYFLPIYRYDPKQIPKAPQPTITSKVEQTLPDDLLLLARDLGLKDVSKIPPLAELGELIGTSTPAETISFIREFASTSDGRDMIKSYIVSEDEEEVVLLNTESPLPEFQGRSLQTENLNTESEEGFFDTFAKSVMSYFNSEPEEDVDSKPLVYFRPVYFVARPGGGFNTVVNKM